jgi:hypothetical protein
MSVQLYYTKKEKASIHGSHLLLSPPVFQLPAGAILIHLSVPSSYNSKPHVAEAVWMQLAKVPSIDMSPPVQKKKKICIHGPWPSGSSLVQPVLAEDESPRLLRRR